MKASEISSHVQLKNPFDKTIVILTTLAYNIKTPTKIITVNKFVLMFEVRQTGSDLSNLVCVNGIASAHGAMGHRINPSWWTH